MWHPMRSAIEVLNAASEYGHGVPIDLDQLLKELLSDCGVDGTGLTHRDLLDAFHGAETARWHDVQSACDAVLAGYSAMEYCSIPEFLRALAAILILANCVRNGLQDSDFSFDYVLGILSANRDKCEDWIRMDVLRIYLCCGS